MPSDTPASSPSTANTNPASMSLPTFRYHPDAIASGSFIADARNCKCCHQARGYIYVGPVYAEADLNDVLCPWCIASGAAHSRFDVTFVDSEAFADAADLTHINEIVERTPGFNAWQAEQWPSCCGEPAAFITPAGTEDIRSRFRYQEGPLMTYIVHELGISGGAATRMLNSLSRDHSPTAYIFKCLHCDNYPAYVDSN